MNTIASGSGGIQGGEHVETQALPLRISVYRESDLILTLLTQDHGKVGALARGARRSRKRFSGSTGMFTLSGVELILRPNSDLSQLQTATPIRTYPRLGSDPQLMGRAAYFCELVDVMTREFDPVEGLLELLDEALSLLGTENCETGSLLRAFEINLLDRLGLWGEHKRCSLCGRPLKKNQAYFQPGAPGSCCTSCGGPLLDEEVETWLRPAPLVQRASQVLSHEHSAKLGSMTWATIRRLSSRALRSVEFLKAMQNSSQSNER